MHALNDGSLLFSMFIAKEIIHDSLNSSFYEQKVSYGRKKRQISVIDEDSHGKYFQIRSISPDGFCYRLWELLGIFLTISILFDLFVASIHNDWTYLIHPATDIYFIIDIFIRFHTEYVDKVSGEVVKDVRRIRYRYFTSWFLFDLILSLPYGFLRHCWESRPALKLLALREKAPHSAFKFFTSREFRKHLIGTFREHVQEGRMMARLWSGQNVSSVVVKQSRIRKAARLSISWYRALGNLRILKSYSAIVRSFISLIMSVRTLSLLSSSKRRL
jgi:hypothetical protein